MIVDVAVESRDARLRALYAARMAACGIPLGELVLDIIARMARPPGRRCGVDEAPDILSVYFRHRR
jgi:hypothetical protein